MPLVKIENLFSVGYFQNFCNVQVFFPKEPLESPLFIGYPKNICARNTFRRSSITKTSQLESFRSSSIHERPLEDFARYETFKRIFGSSSRHRRACEGLFSIGDLWENPRKYNISTRPWKVFHPKRTSSIYWGSLGYLSIDDSQREFYL